MCVQSPELFTLLRPPVTYERHGFRMTDPCGFELPLSLALSLLLFCNLPSTLTLKPRVHSFCSLTLMLLPRSR